MRSSSRINPFGLVLACFGKRPFWSFLPVRGSMGSKIPTPRKPTTVEQRKWKPSKTQAVAVVLRSDSRIGAVVEWRLPGAIGQKGTVARSSSQKRIVVRFHSERLQKNPASCARRERKPIVFLPSPLPDHADSKALFAFEPGNFWISLLIFAPAAPTPILSAFPVSSGANYCC